MDDYSFVLLVGTMIIRLFVHIMRNHDVFLWVISNTKMSDHRDLQSISVLANILLSHNILATFKATFFENLCKFICKFQIRTVFLVAFFSCLISGSKILSNGFLSMPFSPTVQRRQSRRPSASSRPKPSRRRSSSSRSRPRNHWCRSKQSDESNSNQKKDFKICLKILCTVLFLPFFVLFLQVSSIFSNLLS